MKWAAVLLLLVYAAIKGAQLAFAGKASGYRSEPTSLARRLKAGEPAVLIIAAVLTVPPALAATWYYAHRFNAVMQQSVNCYRLITVYRTTPEIMRSNAEHAVYEAYQENRASAFVAGRQLGMTDAMVRRRLDRSASMLASEKSIGAGQAQQARIDAAQRCLHPLRNAVDE